MAGSFGYVAPEVLSRKGHGKPVDIWSTGYAFILIFACAAIYHIPSVITYVLLCGYAPFRSEDPKELVRETMAARPEFHDRYWKSVSQEGTTAPVLPSPLLMNSFQCSQGLYQIVTKP